MQISYQLNYKLIACIILSSLFLQSCDSFSNQVTTSIEESRHGNPEKEEKETDQGEATVLGYFEDLPIELVPMIFSEIDYPYIVACIQLNHFFYEFITGYSQVGLLGVAHKPTAKMQIPTSGLNKCIDFGKLSCTPETIPSFPFYCLMREVRNLPPSFWPYIPSTQVHTLNLRFNRLGVSGVQALAQVLPNTQVHTLNLDYNQIGDSGVQELAKVLPSTQVHTLNLGVNQIGDSGVQALAKVLPSTQIHTLDLGSNYIGDSGMQELSKVLPNTQIHTLDLRYNRIGDEMQQLLKKQHPNITFYF